MDWKDVKKGNLVFYTGNEPMQDNWYPPCGTVGELGESENCVPIVFWRDWTPSQEPILKAGGRMATCVSAARLEPAEIEVGDTVRVKTLDEMRADGATDYEGKGLTTEDSPYWFSYKNADLCGKEYKYAGELRECQCADAVQPLDRSMLVLVRKAKPEPEAASKPEPVSKRPKLEDINERTLVKLRDGKMCGVLSRDSGLAVYDKDKLKCGCYGACFALKDLDCDLQFHDCCNEELSIAATKQFDSQSQALKHILSGIEPKWDWTEDMDKPAPPKTEFNVGDWVEVAGFGGIDGHVGRIAKRHNVNVWSIDFGLGFKGHNCGCLSTETGHWIHEKNLKLCPAPTLTLTASEARSKLGARDGQKVVITDKAIEL